MGWRSTLLIVIPVFAALFSIIYISGIIVSSEKDRHFQELQTATMADAGISRMIEPEDICFTVDEDFLDAYPAFVDSINEADYWAEIESKTDTRYGNYYSNVWLGLNKTQMISLMRTYDGFNETTSNYDTPNNLFTYQDRHFSCGFNYDQNYYLLELTFKTLEQVNRETGYVPVHITKALIEKDLQVPTGVTFAPYNNTLVFFNELSVPVTVELNSRNESISEARLESLIIPPDKMGDLRLAVDWTSLDDTIYHYKVKEYPWIEGDIPVSTRYATECMPTEIAKSLYAQSDFAVKFPSYLPEGFKLACNAENTDSYLIQIYVNQSAVDYYTSRGIMHSRDNPYPFYLYSSTPEDEVKGIFQVHAMRFYSENEDPHKQLREYYQRLSNQTSYSPITNPRFFEMDGSSYLTYNQGRFLSTVEVAIDNEKYVVIGSLPMDEMTTIAKSLS